MLESVNRSIAEQTLCFEQGFVRGVDLALVAAEIHLFAVNFLTDCANGGSAANVGGTQCVVDHHNPIGHNKIIIILPKRHLFFQKTSIILLTKLRKMVMIVL